MALGTLTVPHGGVLCLVMSRDGGMLASGGYDGMIRLWRLPDGTEIRTLQGPHGGVLGLAMSPDGQWITGLTRRGYDYVVHLWRLADGVMLNMQEVFSSWMTCLALSPDGQSLALGSRTGRVCLWPSHWLGSIPVAFGSHIPIEQTSIADMAQVQETLQHAVLADAERAWLTFVLALMRWHRRFDIAPDTTTMGGAFDIALDT